MERCPYCGETEGDRDYHKRCYLIDVYEEEGRIGK